MQLKLPALLVAALVMTAVSCSREPGGASGAAESPATPPAWTVQVQRVSSPAGPATMLPRLTVSDRGLILSWVEREGTKERLRFAERTSSGWSEPTTVASGDNWFLSYGQSPRVKMQLSFVYVVSAFRRTGGQSG